MKKINLIVFFVLAVAASAFAVEVQSPAVLLQQGIYAEETEGNLEKAMEIYSQIRSDYNDVERVSAIATYQLGMCNLKKDKKQDAIKLFQEVVDYYPNQIVAVKKAQQQLDKLGVKNDADKNIFDMLGRASSFIGNKYGEICAEAGYKKLYSNCHIYVVDKDFILRSGGMGYICNFTDKPMTERCLIGGKTQPNVQPNVKFYDMLGNPIDIEIIPDSNRIGHYNLYWTPKKPLRPGAVLNGGWAVDGSKALAKIEQGYQLKMNNHFGDHCIETFFLAVPEGMQIANKSEEYTGKQNIDGWDIYWWKKEVMPNTDHTVNIVLSDVIANYLRPVVIKTSPENFANNVSPDVNQITVTFDKEMFPYGYSWVQTGQPFPETTGNPYFSNNTLSCTLPVKLKAGQYYRISINSSTYLGFKSKDKEPAQEYSLVFATADTQGNPTTIPENLIAEAKKINSTRTKSPCRQINYCEIEPNGTIYFKSQQKYTNEGTTPMTTTSFNTCMNITAIYEKAGLPIKFTVTKEENDFRYDVTFNKPVLPEETIEGTIAGTIEGQIKSVVAMKDVYQYYMKHWPEAGQPTLLTYTFLLPKGAEIISTVPDNMLIKERDGRIELCVEELIPTDGSLTITFQYKLKTSE